MRYYYKVTLLADVVMSSLSSTEVSESLDYLSGSAFMGIAANYLFKTKSEGYDVFDDIFSGKIRFLDAHPLIDGKRSYKIPLCLHKPKVKGAAKKYRFEGKPLEEGENKIQMKQVRKGFFIADGGTWTKVEPEHQYTMKSSYDSETRHAQDNALFGYDALVKGSEWVFIMEFDDEKDNIADELDKFFTSKNHRIGKSKTSQYGNVKIERNDSLVTDCGTYEATENKYKVYADSRLCFFDENGQPTFQPTPEQLGFKDGEILWNESFVRKYVFTPRNATRNAYDGDIACIDKGSVIVVESSTGHNGRNVVGEYRSIGLGQIIVNPKFLEKEPEKLEPLKAKTENNKKDEANCDDPLFEWISAKHSEAETEKEMAQIVIAKVESLVSKSISSSQWGMLRTKARMAIVEHQDWETFESAVFDAYLKKERLLSKWSGKREELKDICDEFYGTLEENIKDEKSKDLYQLRFFELLCAAAAKATPKDDKKGGE